MDQYRDVYRQEAEELLTELEAALLELEDTPDDLELVGRAFRAMHTIKGSGAMFGFDAVASFTHQLETVFDRVRNGKLPVTKELVDVALASKDHIRDLLGETPDLDEEKSLRARLEAFDEGAAPKPADSPPSQHPAAEELEGRESTTYRIRFRPGDKILATGLDPTLLLDELRELGTCRVVAHTEGIPPLEALDPQKCCTGWDVVLTTVRDLDAVRDVFVFVEDQGEVSISVVDPAEGDEDPEYKKLGEILVEKGDITPEQMKDALGAQKQRQRRFGEILQEQIAITPDKVEAALAEQEAVRESRKKRQEVDSTSSIRVPAAKLDILVDLVGELVIAQARLTQTAADRADPELLAIAEDVERLSAELRDNTLNIRMLPIGTTFGRFRRLVRDLSAELGKEVELVTEGADTELDKTVIERLADPLVHLIRNAIDHGIEPPEKRAAAGKRRGGTVRLSAAHSGAAVVIEIADDGAGLDHEAIRAKALERGILSADSKPSERELFELVFAPGFSTAKVVSNVSGRGVGMDVVKRSIDALRGSIEVASRRGAGTTITIRLPLTLAIIEGLLVQVGGERFVLPLSVVEECVELTREDLSRAHGRRTADVRGHLVPYMRLREWFGIGGASPGIEQIVIARIEDEKFGFVVDNVVGQHQTVIKSLGKMYQGIEGLSGATILGDGKVALILDAPQLIGSAVAQEIAAA